MKTQEEIEQLAEKHYTQITLSQRTAFKLGYTQCQEDMADKKYTEEDMIGFLDWSLGMEVVEMLCNNKTKQEIFQEYIIYKAYAEARRNNSLNKQE